MATEEQIQWTMWSWTYGSGRDGQRLTISDREVTKLAFCLAKHGSPTGNITFTIRRVSNDSIILSKVWGDAADLSTDLAWKEVTFDSPATINEEVRVAFEASGGDIGNYINSVYATNVKEGEYYSWWSSAGASEWTDGPQYDFVYRYTYTAIVVVPTVTTQAATNVQATTATGNGTITDTGGENCTRRGFCYKVGTSGNPTTADSVAYDDGSFGTGAYTKGLTGLSSGTSYRVRAFAINSAGTGYGTTVQILTKPAAPTNVAATDGDHTDKVVITWTKSTGATGYQVYRDGTPLGWLGDVATHDDSGAAVPTITPGTAVASDGLHTDKVALSLSGQSANKGTTHTYKVRAKNAAGESADSVTNTGYRGVGSLTYQWQRSAADSNASYSNIAGATAATHNDTIAPAPTITPGTTVASDGASTLHVALSLSGQSANAGAGRYYKCVLNATGATQQTSTANRGYRGVGSLTYQWQRSAADSDASYSNIDGATTASYNDTGAPADGNGRYYRCVENAAGAAQQISAVNRGHRAIYHASGYIGDVIDCTALVDTYDRLEWAKELPSSDQAVAVKVRSSPDQSTWSDWETIYSSPCTSFTTPVQRYLEWKATLSTDDPSYTPKLEDLSFYWTKKVE